MENHDHRAQSAAAGPMAAASILIHLWSNSVKDNSETRASAHPPYDGKHSRLPYGAYIRADGSEVLFDRNYHPVMERAQDGSNVRPAAGWIKHEVTVWFYNDACSPRGQRRFKARQDALSRCEAALTAFTQGGSIAPYVIRSHDPHSTNGICRTVGWPERLRARTL